MSSCCKIAEKTRLPPGLAWVGASNGRVPNGAIEAGRDPDGQRSFVGRANHAGGIEPGKISPSHGCLLISYGGKEIAYKEYEVLMLADAESVSVRWVESADGKAPPNAVAVGWDKSNKEAYHVGQNFMGDVANVTVCGKVSKAHKCCYVPFNGKEHKLKRHTVLIADRIGQQAGLIPPQVQGPHVHPGVQPVVHPGVHPGHGPQVHPGAHPGLMPPQPQIQPGPGAGGFHHDPRVQEELGFVQPKFEKKSEEAS